MQRTSAQKSSNVESYGYDPEKGLLEIEFKGGSVYHYFNVPAEEYEGFAKAESKGSYFSSRIKNYYTYEKQQI